MSVLNEQLFGPSWYRILDTYLLNIQLPV